MKRVFLVIIKSSLLFTALATMPHFEVAAQEKQKVLDRSKKFPRWAKGGWSRGKMFKQKKRSGKNTRLCPRKETAYWFITHYDFKRNRKRRDGTPAYAPRQDAERLAYAQLSSQFAELVAQEVKSEVGSKNIYVDDLMENVQTVSDEIKTSATIKGLLRVGLAWERVAMDGNEYWRIHTWGSVCKNEYDKLVKQAVTKSGGTPAAAERLLANLDENKSEAPEEFSDNE